MGLFLLDVGIKKDSMYKMEIFNKEKKEVDIIRKEFNLPTSKVLLYKDDDIFYGKDNVEYLSVSFVGTKEFIMSCNEMLPVKGAIRKHNLSSVYEIRWYGKKAVNFCKWLFQYPELYHGIKYTNYLYKMQAFRYIFISH